jgi:hypothetical protein
MISKLDSMYVGTADDKDLYAVSVVTADPNMLMAHPLALVFPQYGGREMAELLADLKAKAIYEQQVLDGWNRRCASIQAGMAKVPTRVYTGTDPQGFVISKNEIRRHMTNDQRAMIAAKLADMARGTRTDLGPAGPKSDGVSLDAAARKMKTSRRQTVRAKAVLKEDPKLANEVAEGKTRLSTTVQKTADKKQPATVSQTAKSIGEAKAKKEPHKDVVLYGVKFWPNPKHDYDYPSLLPHGGTSAARFHIGRRGKRQLVLHRRPSNGAHDAAAGPGHAKPQGVSHGYKVHST